MATLIRPAGCFTFALNDTDEVLGESADMATAWDNKQAPGILTIWLEEGDDVYLTSPSFLAENARVVKGGTPYSYGPIAYEDLSQLAVYSPTPVTVYVCVDIVRSEGK